MRTPVKSNYITGSHVYFMKEIKRERSSSLEIIKWISIEVITEGTGAKIYSVQMYLFRSQHAE